MECFTEWQLQPLLEDAQLALSEIVTNGVVYGRTPLVIAISCADRVCEIGVTDFNPELPIVRPRRRDIRADIDAANRRLGSRAGSADGADDRDPGQHVGESGALTGGRGLLLLDALGQWGVTPGSNGKAVWFRMPAPAGWHHRDACACSWDPDAVTLHSGHRAVHVA